MPASFVIGHFLSTYCQRTFHSVLCTHNIVIKHVLDLFTSFNLCRLSLPNIHMITICQISRTWFVTTLVIKLWVRHRAVPVPCRMVRAPGRVIYMLPYSGFETRHGLMPMKYMYGLYTRDIHVRHVKLLLMSAYFEVRIKIYNNGIKSLCWLGSRCGTLDSRLLTRLSISAFSNQPRWNLQWLPGKSGSIYRTVGRRLAATSHVAKENSLGNYSKQEGNSRDSFRTSLPTGSMTYKKDRYQLNRNQI